MLGLVAKPDLPDSLRSSNVLATFKAWADDNFGTIRSAFAVFDSPWVLSWSDGNGSSKDAERFNTQLVGLCDDISNWLILIGDAKLYFIFNRLV